MMTDWKQIDDDENEHLERALLHDILLRTHLGGFPLYLGGILDIAFLFGTSHTDGILGFDDIFHFR